MGNGFWDGSQVLPIIYDLLPLENPWGKGRWKMLLYEIILLLSSQGEFRWL